MNPSSLAAAPSSWSTWTRSSGPLPEREEAGSPNVVGAVALGVALEQLRGIGFQAITEHDEALRARLMTGLAAVPGVRVLGPAITLPGLPVVSFIVEESPHALVAARLSAEFAIGVRDGCFCAHPYLVRLLALSSGELSSFRERARRGERVDLPGAVRVSAGASTTLEEVDRFLEAASYRRHDVAGGPCTTAIH